MKQFAAEMPFAPTTQNFRVVTPQKESKGDSFQRDVVTGLAAQPKKLPEKYFYDRHGSELFDAICQLPEYYPTRTEVALLRAKRGEIAQLTGSQANVIEFGSGASTKVRILLDALAAPASYVGVDISREYLLHATQALAFDYPDLSVLAVCADFTRPFPVPALSGRGMRLGFFPGSTIGNLNHADAEAFLRHAAVALRPGGGLLVGVDLKKETEILHAAYNDAKGITAAFNLNLLTRINRELAGTFELRHFAHEAFYEPGAGRIEMHLRSLIDQDVRVGGSVFHFAENETIHTENSHKYTVAEFQMLARRAGLRPVRAWSDPDRLFSLHYLSVPR